MDRVLGERAVLAVDAAEHVVADLPAARLMAVDAARVATAWLGHDVLASLGRHLEARAFDDAVVGVGVRGLTAGVDLDELFAAVDQAQVVELGARDVARRAAGDVDRVVYGAGDGQICDRDVGGADREDLFGRVFAVDHDAVAVAGGAAQRDSLVRDPEPAFGLVLLTEAIRAVSEQDRGAGFGAAHDAGELVGAIDGDLDGSAGGRWERLAAGVGAAGVATRAHARARRFPRGSGISAATRCGSATRTPAARARAPAARTAAGVRRTAARAASRQGRETAARATAARRRTAALLVVTSRVVAARDAPGQHCEQHPSPRTDDYPRHPRSISRTQSGEKSIG